MCDQKACSGSMRRGTRHGVGTSAKGLDLELESRQMCEWERIFSGGQRDHLLANGKRGSWTYWDRKTKGRLVKESRWFPFLLKDFRISMFESISEESWKSMEFLGLQGRRGGPRKMELSQVSYQGVEIQAQEQGVGLQARWSLNRRKAQQQGNGCFSRMGCVMNCSLKFLSANRTWMWTRGESAFSFGAADPLRQWLPFFFWIMTHSIEYLFSHKQITYTYTWNEAIFHGTVLMLTMQATCWYFLLSSVSFERKYWHHSWNWFLNPWKDHDLMSEKNTVLSCTMYQQVECHRSHRLVLMSHS